MKVTVAFSDYTIHTYNSMKEAEAAIIEAHANEVFPEYVEDINENPLYCTYKVKIHKEP